MPLGLVPDSETGQYPSLGRPYKTRLHRVRLRRDGFAESQSRIDRERERYGACHRDDPGEAKSEVLSSLRLPLARLGDQSATQSWTPRLVHKK